MKSTVAFLAMPPDHSTSRSASPISATLSAERSVQATLVLMQTMFNSGALKPRRRTEISNVRLRNVRLPGNRTCIPYRVARAVNRVHVIDRRPVAGSEKVIFRSRSK